MINFKFDDKTDIENKIHSGYVNQENPEETIRDLARYNYHVLNMSKEDNYDAILSYMVNNCSDFYEEKYFKIIYRNISSAKKYKFRNISPVKITKTEIDKIIGDSMKKQAETEKKTEVGIDESAHASADALGKIAAFGFDGKTKESLYSLGYMVGRYVYILDAADDLEDDIKRKNFNPFKGRFEQAESEAFAQNVRGMLNLTQSGALDAFDSLEVKRFGDILENIILDGLTFSAEKVLKKYLPESENNKVYHVD